jgi:hypothetical protein
MSVIWFALTGIGAFLTYLAYNGQAILGLNPDFLFYMGIGMAIIPLLIALMTIYFGTRGTAAERAR